MDNNTGNGFAALLLAIIVIAVVVLTVWYKISLWSECRATNSFLYCWHFMSK